MTPTFCCGFECGQAAVAGLHWVGNNTPTFDTVTVRSGARSGRCHPASSTGVYFQRDAYASGVRTTVHRIYLQFSTLPDANCQLLCVTAGSAPAKQMGALFNQSDSKIYAAMWDGTTFTTGTNGISVTTGQWYRVEVKIVTTANPHTIDVQVDGTACTQLTNGQAASDQSNLTVGLKGNSGTLSGDAYLDDFIESQTAADYPIGAGYVNHFVPTSDGTHNTGTAGTFIRGTAGANITNSTTDAYLLIDEVPMDDTTPDTNDFVTQAGTGSTNYTEHVFGPASGISTPTAAPRAVDAIVAYHQTGTGAGVSSFKLNDNGTESSIVDLSGAGQTTTRYSRKQYATAPTGGAWTVAAGAGNFNNIRVRFGYSSDANPDQYFDCAMIEAEFAAVVGRTTRNTHAFPLGMEIGMNLWGDL